MRSAGFRGGKSVERRYRPLTSLWVVGAVVHQPLLLSDVEHLTKTPRGEYFIDSVRLRALTRLWTFAFLGHGQDVFRAHSAH